jgi:phosphate:Na+ symporter
MFNTLGQLFAGLGLFFLGLNTVSTNLKQLSSRRFRSLIARFTTGYWMGSLIGFLTGAITQSTTAVTVVLANMNASGLVDVRRSMPIVAWSNVGTTVLIFLTVIDINLGVLYLLGASAVAFVFARQVTWKSACGTGLGIGLLLFGMTMVKVNAVHMKDYPQVAAVLAHAQGSYVLALLGGVLIAFLTQSTTAAILIAVAMVDAGVLGVNETIMAIYGGNLGSTFARMLLATGVKGSSVQIGRLQDLFKGAIVVGFVPLFYLELAGVPLVGALVRAVSDQVKTQMALVNLVCNLGIAVLFSLLFGPLGQFLSRRWPALETEDFARVQYLNPSALDDPETALDLVEKEQTRLVGRLPSYLVVLRTPPGQKSPVDYQEMHMAYGRLWKEVDVFLAELMHRPLAPKTAPRVSNVHNRHGVFGLLEENVFQLVTAVRETPPSAHLAPLVDNFVEALDFILLTAGDAVTSLGAADAQLLGNLCADRGELMGKLRGVYLSGEQELRPQDKSLLLDVTTLFDRIVWMLRRLAGLLEQNRQAQG